MELRKSNPNYKDKSWKKFNTPTPEHREIFYCLYAAGHVYANPGYCVNRDNMDNIYVAYTLSGTGYLEYRNKKYTIKPGMGFILKCTDSHLYYTDDEDPWNKLWFHFYGNNSKYLYEEIYKNNGPVFYEKSDNIMEKSIKSVLNLVKENDPQLDIKCNPVLARIITEIIMEHNRNYDIKSRLPEEIKKAMDIMDNKYQEDINLDDVAKEIGISKYYLIRLYKKYFNITPYNYLIKNRINQSKYLLKTTNLNIEQISYQVGFNNTSQYIKMFKKYEDITPHNFRIKWQGS